MTKQTRGEPDFLMAVDECAESVRETVLLRLKSRLPELFEDGAPYAVALAEALDECVVDVRMPIANALLRINPETRRRAKKRVR